MGKPANYIYVPRSVIAKWQMDRDKGMSINEVATKHNSTYSVVSSRTTTPVNKRRYSHDSEHRKMWQLLRSSGLSVRSISEVSEFSYDTILRNTTNPRLIRE